MFGFINKVYHCTCFTELFMRIMGFMSIEYTMSIATLNKLDSVNFPGMTFTNKPQDQKQDEALLCSTEDFYVLLLYHY